MDRADFPKFYVKNSGLIQMVSAKGFARAQSIGCGSIGFDDIYQEMCEVFIRAYDLFDPSVYKFSTYYMRAAFNRLNRLLEKVEVERIANGTRSVEELGSFVGEDDENLAMTVEDVTSVGPEEAAAMNSLMRSWVRQLSPIAAQMLEWIVDPPDFIECEFEAQRAFAGLSRDSGVRKRSRIDMDLSFVARVMRVVLGDDITDAYVRDAIKEIKEIAQHTL